MPQHGIEQHFVRPDRVYATGVWTPIVGYQPAEAANQVAARFVSGGQGLGMFRGTPFGRTRALARSIALRGPGATFWSWLRERIAAVRVRLQVMAVNRDLWKQRITGALPPGQAKKERVVDTSPREVSSMGQIPLLMSPEGAARLLQAGSAASEEKTSAPPLGMVLRQRVTTVNDANAHWRGVINSSSGFRPPGAGY